MTAKISDPYPSDTAPVAPVADEDLGPQPDPIKVSVILDPSYGPVDDLTVTMIDAEAYEWTGVDGKSIIIQWAVLPETGTVTS